MGPRHADSVLYCTPGEILEAGYAGPLLAVSDDGVVQHTLVVLDLDGVAWNEALIVPMTQILDSVTPVVVGVASDELPAAAAPITERLTTTLAPGGPANHWVSPDESDLAEIIATVTGAPVASLAFRGLMKNTMLLSIVGAVLSEAATYSMLLAGEEFARWRRETPRREIPDIDEPVLLERAGNELRITLNNPQRRNTFASAMRDGILEALSIPGHDDSIERVRIRGAGPVYSAGGDLDEFGTATSDTAYTTRLSRNMGLAMNRIRNRLEVHVHGAAIGAGIETTAFAGHVSAHPETWFSLPELKFGLIPGAGGTVSIPRRIGPWRTAWLALTGKRLDAATALRWGLVDELT